MNEKKWQIPKKFELTPEIVEQADLLQKQWAESLNTPFANSDGKTRERGLATILIREYREIGLHKLTKNQLLELAEAFSLIGRFDEASLMAKKAQEMLVSALYLQIWGAIWRPDEHWCDCGDEHQYVEKDIWSLKHQEERPLLRCNKCGCINVSNLPKILEQQRNMRAQARELTKGMNLKNAKQTLTSRNHTHEKLIAKNS